MEASMIKSGLFLFMNYIVKLCEKPMFLFRSCYLKFLKCKTVYSNPLSNINKINALINNI
jgi:hypothetical protein